MVRAMVCVSSFLVALLLPLAAGEMNAGWSCDGPLPSVHGPSSGDLVAGEIELLLHSTPLDPREAHAEVLGSTVELELVAPPGIDGLEGFLITTSKGFVRAADSEPEPPVPYELRDVAERPARSPKRRKAVSWAPT